MSTSSPTSTGPAGRSPLAPFPAIPEEVARRYREAGYWEDETFQQLLLRSIDAHRESLAVVGRTADGLPGGSSLDTVRWTYGQLEEQALAAAARLREVGVRPGDRVILQLPNTVEYLAHMVGAFLYGALPVFALPKHRAGELEQFAARTDAAAHVVAQGAENHDYRALHAEYAARLQEQGLMPPALIDVANPQTHAPAPLRREDLPEPVRNRGARRLSENAAFLQLSGGTTGISKLIPRTHAAYLYSVRESARICGLDASTRMLVAMPAAHNFTMSSPGILGVLWAGGAVILAADPSPQTAFALIERERADIAPLVPPLAQAWIASAKRRAPDLSSLRLVQVGGARFAPAAAEQVRLVLGARLQQVFGMAEGLVNYTREDDDEQLVLTTQGTPISPDDEVLILDDEGRPVPEGQPGHLLTRGPYTIRGYYREEHANRTSFTDDGFYRTGDIVRRHPSGHLEVTGRAKDQINRAGEKIAVDELEDLALDRLAVADAVAVGIPDEAVGERVGLILVPQPGKQLGEDPRAAVRAVFRDAGLAEFKIPERVVVMDRLPLTNVGKISRKQLRAHLAERLAD